LNGPKLFSESRRGSPGSIANRKAQIWTAPQRAKFKRDAVWFLNTIYCTKFQIKCGNFVAIGLTIIPLFHLVVWGQVNGHRNPNEHAPVYQTTCISLALVVVEGDWICWNAGGRCPSTSLGEGRWGEVETSGFSSEEREEKQILNCREQSNGHNIWVRS